MTSPPPAAATAVFAAFFGFLPAACLAQPKSPTGPAGVDVVIGRTDFGQTVEVNQGELVLVRPPMDDAEWQVDYSSDVLEMLTPPDHVRSPGPDGWRLKASARGTTDFTVSPVMQGSRGAPPPAPPRFTVTIRVP